MKRLKPLSWEAYLYPVRVQRWGGKPTYLFWRISISIPFVGRLEIIISSDRRRKIIPHMPRVRIQLDHHTRMLWLFRWDIGKGEPEPYRKPRKGVLRDILARVERGELT